MKKISILKNRIQTYAWGSHTAIPELLGAPAPSETPQAELWMGAHPKAPSEVRYENQWISLAHLIEKYPEDILGEDSAAKFDNRLPYLFKVLAAEKPLSIQAHPNKEQAIQGFERENQENIPLNAANRNYKDQNHKPECICALTPFYALNGFRNIPDTCRLMESLCPERSEDEFDGLLRHLNIHGLRAFFNGLMTIDDTRKKDLIGKVALNAKHQAKGDPISEWIVRLHNEYPGDIGVLAPVFLNLICLEPGQAMFLPAGELHSYLDGVGIELMANSDNVLRGGLTPKHVDVPELMNVLNFEERDVNILSPRKISAYESVYDTPAEEFILSVITVRDGRKDAVFPRTNPGGSAEILLCVEGSGVITDIKTDDTLEINKGMSVIKPAAAGKYRIEGNVTFYKASVHG